MVLFFSNRNPGNPNIQPNSEHHARNTDKQFPSSNIPVTTKLDCVCRIVFCVCVFVSLHSVCVCVYAVFFRPSGPQFAVSHDECVRMCFSVFACACNVIAFFGLIKITFFRSSARARAHTIVIQRGPPALRWRRRQRRPTSTSTLHARESCQPVRRCDTCSPAYTEYLASGTPFVYDSRPLCHLKGMFKCMWDGGRVYSIHVMLLPACECVRVCVCMLLHIVRTNE